MVSIPTQEKDLWNWSGILSFPLALPPDHVHSFIPSW